MYIVCHADTSRATTTLVPLLAWLQHGIRAIMAGLCMSHHDSEENIPLINSRTIANRRWTFTLARILHVLKVALRAGIHSYEEFSNYNATSKTSR
jgi:hypothetical protein